jgi:hypothetical protein
MSTKERAHFRLIQAPCRGTLLCWVNPRLPNYCPECETGPGPFFQPRCGVRPSTTGRPIFPVALATSRRKVLDNWDRSAINLPFSRGATVVGDPIRVPAEAGPEALEQARSALEQALNAATERAYAIASRLNSNAGNRRLNKLETKL